MAKHYLIQVQCSAAFQKYFVVTFAINQVFGIDARPFITSSPLNNQLINLCHSMILQAQNQNEQNKNACQH